MIDLQAMFKTAFSLAVNGLVNSSSMFWEYSKGSPASGAGPPKPILGSSGQSLAPWMPNLNWCPLISFWLCSLSLRSWSEWASPNHRLIWDHMVFSWGTQKKSQKPFLTVRNRFWTMENPRKTLETISQTLETIFEVQGLLKCFHPTSPDCNLWVPQPTVTLPAHHTEDYVVKVLFVPTDKTNSVSGSHISIQYTKTASGPCPWSMVDIDRYDIDQHSTYYIILCMLRIDKNVHMMWYEYNI